MAERKQRFRPHNTVNGEVWRAALYVRLSDEDRNKKNRDDFSLSIRNQISFLKAYVDKNNADETEDRIEIHEIYSDDDLTGMNFNRGGFQKMMHAVEEGEVDCIIVKSLSRFGRYDTEMFAYMERTFERTGREVRFIALSDNYDSLYDELDMITKMKVLINREYSEIQHKNVSIAMHSMQLEGLYVGAFAPYGYEKDKDNKNKLVVDVYAAGIVRRIFEEYLAGQSVTQIASGLTRDGILNRTAYKRLRGSNYVCGAKISVSEVHWTADAVKQVLENEVYTGTMVQGKTVKKRLIDSKPTVIPKENWVRVRNTHEAVVSAEDWQLARSMMKNIKRDVVRQDEVTIFKGILKCGDCGHAMRKKWEKYQCKTTGTLSKYLYYNCGTYRDFAGETKSCTGHYISDRILRRVILDDLNVILGQVRDLRDMVRDRRSKLKQNMDCQREKEEMASLQNALRINENRLKAARNKWLDGKLEDEDYSRIKQELENENKVYEGQIAGVRKEMLRQGQEQGDVWIDELLRNNRITEVDRETVIRLIHKISIYEDKHIEIEYKFSGEWDALFQTGV